MLFQKKIHSRYVFTIFGEEHECCVVNEQKFTTFIQTVLSKNSTLVLKSYFKAKAKSNTLVLKLTLIVMCYLNKFLKNIPYPTFKLSYQGFLLPLVRISSKHIVFILYYVLCPSEVLVLYIDLYPRKIICLSYLCLFWSLGNFGYWNNHCKKDLNSLKQNKLCHK